jgi:transposase
VLALLGQGMPASQIAERVGCTTRHVYKLAKAAGTAMATGARPRAPRRDRGDRERVLAMWRQGVPVQQIAKAVDRKPATIYKIAQAARAYVINGQRPPPSSSRNSRRPLLTDDHIATTAVATSIPDPRLKAADQLASGRGLTTAEVAGLFRVSEQAVRQWASHHKLPWVWVKGCRRYPADAVAQLAQQHHIPVPDWLPTATTNQEPA